MDTSFTICLLQFLLAILISCWACLLSSSGWSLSSRPLWHWLEDRLSIRLLPVNCLADTLHSTYQFKQDPYGHKLSPLWKECHPAPQEGWLEGGGHHFAPHPHSGSGSTKSHGDNCSYYIWAIHNLQFWSLPQHIYSPYLYLATSRWTEVTHYWPCFQLAFFIPRLQAILDFLSMESERKVIHKMLIEWNTPLTIAGMTPPMLPIILATPSSYLQLTGLLLNMSFRRILYIFQKSLSWQTKSNDGEFSTCQSM